MSTPISNISKELSEQIEREAEARYPLLHNNIDTQKERRHVYTVGATEYAALLQDSERRRNEAMELLSPLLDYGQSKEANIPMGQTVTTVILQRATRFEQAKKALEDLLSCHIKMRVIGLSNKINAAKTLLASWKEEGKEVDNG